MGELQERLREDAKHADYYEPYWFTEPELLHEAADELDRLTAENARLRAKLELTPDNVEKAARAMALDANDYGGPELQWGYWTDSATAAIKALGADQ